MFIHKVNRDHQYKLSKLKVDYPIDNVATYDQVGDESRSFHSFVNEFIHTKCRRKNGSVDFYELLQDYLGLDRTPLKVKDIVHKYNVSRQYVNKVYHSFLKFIRSDVTRLNEMKDLLVK